MDFTNEINARNLGAKELPERSRANVNNTAFVLIDPSRLPVGRQVNDHGYLYDSQNPFR